MSEAGRVLTWVEQDDGEVADTSGRLLTLARGLAEAAGTELEAATIGTVGEAGLQQLRTHGVTRLHVVDHHLLGSYAPAAWGRALAQLVDAEEPAALVAAATDRGAEVLAHVAAITDLPFAANCVAVEPGGDGTATWRLTRQRWGGVLLEDAVLRVPTTGETPPTALLTLVPHAVSPAPAATAGGAALSPFAPELSAADTIGRVEERIGRTAGVSLATAPVVVSGGRGVGSAEGFTLLEELAELLGGAVGCSRVATNNGWRSHNDQVGQTGTRVAPDLYIALGISGATQHWVGCMHAKRILAVNIDPDAPLVTRADDAVIGDLHALLPPLVDAVRARKGATARGT